MGKTRKNKNLKIVSFDEEIIKKNNADKLLSKSDKKNDSKNVELTVTRENENCKIESNEIGIKKRKKAKKQKNNGVDDNYSANQESHSEVKPNRSKRKLETNEKQNLNNNAEHQNGDSLEESQEKKVKRKKREKVNESNIPEQREVTDEVSVENPKVKTAESIRAQKRKKHAKLLEDKRLKTELTTQENTLNYLSKWKHCRSEWKFEKLKQIWLQQNLFDASKIPNEFWETAVEYFSGSKGFIRNVVMRDALKIIEKEESTEEEDTDENYLLILKRARDIVQNLQ